MSTTTAQGHATPHDDTSIIRPLRRDSAERVLVCFGFCGGGTAPYRPWASLLPDDLDLALICYPGREGRFLEGQVDSWDALAADAAALTRQVAERPYLLFGHSMGGWMAYDVATRLQDQGVRVAESVIISSCNAPYASVRERDKFPAQNDTDEQLMAWMRNFGALPDYVLEDPDLTAMALDLMRADIKVRDSFHCDDTKTLLSPLTVLLGETDEVIEDNAEVRWAEVAAAGFSARHLPGGHFYTPEVWSVLPRYFPWDAEQGGSVA
ncbi:thioesterase II family protein [Saccharothrix australiensis]|uniref:Surfactin synthase thioesterase subunit n=1 Tax=Saccharothrix australiensis TaxID=2072 RepID=A0A495W0M8_9PSEU|nr:alpha/beta fold hydrolase [Saccharothrix australiensis]RKT54245.1 surfactin synthase thioesterase subunit [Saccharothrix australiensis]